MHVLIGGVEVPILLKTKKAMKENFACFCGNTESIHLLQNMPQELRRKTLAHECFHSFLFLTGYNELLQDVSENFEEAITRGFEQHLGNLFQFNEEIEAWINAQK